MKTREEIKAAENLKIDKDKLYQRKDKRAQVENLTLLKETKKPKSSTAKK
jgi:hypothetical protein